MSININSPGNGPGHNAPIDRTGNSGNSAAPRVQADKPAESAADRVTLTSDAARIARAAETLAADSGFDEARVADIKASIESGKFEIDADKIASRLLELERDLGPNRNG